MAFTDEEALALNRAVGDGWSLLAGGARRGESIIMRGGSAGISGEPTVVMNWAVVQGPEGVEDALRAIVLRLRERAVPGIVCVGARAAAEAAPVARELGLAADHPVPLMVCGTEGFAPGEARCVAEHVTSAAQASEVAETLAAAFGLELDLCVGFLGKSWRVTPGVDLFLSRIEGRATAALATARVEDTVGVYAMGTRPDRRRRGAGAAALSAAMQFHLDHGASLFVLQASALGEPLYRSLGYEKVEDAAVWVVMPEQA